MSVIDVSDDGTGPEDFSPKQSRCDSIRFGVQSVISIEKKDEFTRPSAKTTITRLQQTLLVWPTQLVFPPKVQNQ